LARAIHCQLLVRQLTKCCNSSVSVCEILFEFAYLNRLYEFNSLLLCNSIATGESTLAYKMAPIPNGNQTITKKCHHTRRTFVLCLRSERETAKWCGGWWRVDAPRSQTVSAPVKVLQPF